MTDLLSLHKYFLSAHLKKGGIAVDFTMGNGHDTEYLCRAVYGGEDLPGHVYAFDVQRQALESTEKLLTETGCPQNYTTGSITAQEENAFLLLNQDRAANGRSALELDPALCDLARLKSRDMYLNNYFSHTSPTYGSAAQMLSTYGYSFTSVGENIAHHATVEKAQAAFMSSSGHRQNILGSQWTKVGIGVWEDSQGFVYVTQLFVR